MSAGFISVSHDFTPYFHFRSHATFDRNLIHSADACFLVMACVGYSRAQLKTLSGLLKLTNDISLTLSGRLPFESREQIREDLSNYKKTVIPRALVGYEMIIANETRSAELAIYHLTSNGRSWNNC